MRNSLIPLIAAVLLFVVGLALIRPTVGRGQGGPEVHAGILRLPKRDPLRTASAPLTDTTVANLASGARDDGRWRIVVVSGADREPTTRAAMLALGEALYTAGMVAVLDPLPAASESTPPLPLPADRLIRIATRTATTGDTPAAPWHATVVFTVVEPRLPPGHPAEGLLPKPTQAGAVVVVEHDGRPAGSQAPTWPERWAATGRSTVQAMLGALLPPAGLQAATDHLGSDWGSALPLPPTTPELRWAGSFQHDLARGWVGRIGGRSVTTSIGKPESAIDPLLRRLKGGSWEEVAGGGTWRQWGRLRDGAQQCFALRDDGDGWTTTMWVERPDLTGLVDGWLAAAARGETAARAHLDRLLRTPGLPDAQRLRLEKAGK